MILRILVAALLTYTLEPALACCGGGARTAGPVRSLDDVLPEITLQGTVMIVPPDSTHSWTWYLLDSNGDGTADYHLLFGPPSYVPQGGAQRPSNGDQISVIAGLFGCEQATTPMMLVYEINGQFWRENGDGTAAAAGHRGFVYSGCGGVTRDSTGSNLPQELPRIQGYGTILYWLCWPPPENPPGIESFAIAGDTSGWEYYDANFGRYWRNTDSTDTECFVGGLLATADSTRRPWIVVYEFGGQLIREPGDTIHLASEIPQSAEPVRTGEPESYLTAHNYPNPFNATTTIIYSIPESGSVRVTVYDLVGREVTTLASGFQAAGQYAATWNGSSAASGLYFYRVTLNGKSFVNRMILLK